MSRKSFLLICFVLLFSILGEAFGAVEVERRSWWSDLEPSNHLWSEPNNWWAIDVHFLDNDGDGGLDSGETVWYVKADQNEVPDVNIAALVGKGEAHIMYPVELRNMILDGYVMTDPTIDGTVVAEANYVLCGGGTSYDHYWTGNGSQTDPDINNWDPNFHHYLTMTGGTLTVGTPQTWEGYEVVWWGDMFNGQFGSGRFCVGSVPLDKNVMGASGTLTMSGGTINVGGHMEVGAWGGTGTLNMTDGEINIVQGIYCPASWWGGTAYINLHGGTINARYIRMTDDIYGGNIGIIDVTEGELILEQDEKDKLIYYEDYENVGEYGNVFSITSYGAGHGEIITDGNFPAQVGKRAALIIDYDVMRERKTTLAAATPTDPNHAWNPGPPDGAANAKGPVSSLTNPVLSWSAGAIASSHHVYFGTNFEDVNDATTFSGPELYRGKQQLEDVNYAVPETLDSLATYYWRIDETYGASTWKGDVWSFRMANLGKAQYFNPDDRAAGVSPLAALSWTSGIYTTEHHVYFSDDFNDVNDRDLAARTIWPVLTEEYDPPGTFDFETQYYWAVDEVNGLDTWPSVVLTFKADDHIVVEDFDGYEDTSELRDTWNDGWLNETGSEVTSETEIVRDGNSLKFSYDNYSYDYYYSEIGAAAADFEVGTNFRAGSVKSLVLWFYGKLENDVNEQMYVVLEDSVGREAEVPYYGDMNDIKLAEWQEWNIDLDDFTDANSSLDLTDIAEIYIGFGIRGNEETEGGGGTVWFEDIRFYRARCVKSFSYGFGDITGDCVTDAYDLEVMAQDWLIHDYNTLGYAGTLMGFDDPDAAWSEDGADNGSLYFPGIVDVNGDLVCGDNTAPIPDYSTEYPGYIEIPAIGLNSANVSMTAWIKTDGIQCEWGTGIVFIRADSASGLNLFYRPDDEVVELAYHWNDQHWGFESGLYVPDNAWTFVALVVTPISGKLYMDDEIAFDEGGTWNPEPFADPMWIGKDWQGVTQARYFKGWIDDVRIYDYSLTDDEILYVRTFGGSGDPPGEDPFSWYKLDETSGTNAEDSSGGLIVYWPVLSNANFVDPEPQYQRAVNFRDYSAIADNWLEEILFPTP